MRGSRNRNELPAPPRRRGNRLIYVGDFGELAAVPNRQMPNGNVLGIDPDYVELAYLRPMFVDKPAKTGDAWKTVMLAEYTLKMLNEAAHFSIEDLS